MSDTKLAQGYVESDEERADALARKQARQFDTATPEGMDALTQSLIRSKTAGADLTGMDAQLLRAAKLRDTPFNADGFHQTGGIGSAMSAFANVLDRRDGRQQYDGLEKQATEAKRLVAAAAAAKEAREMGFENSAEARAVSGEERASQTAIDAQGNAEESQRLALRKALDAQANSDRDYALKLREHEEGTFKDRQDSGAGAAGGVQYGVDKRNDPHMKQTREAIQGLGTVNEVLSALQAKPELANPVPGLDFNILQKAASGLMKQAPGTAKFGLGLLGNDEDETKAIMDHSLESGKLRSNLELGFSQGFRSNLIGSAQGVAEADRVRDALDVDPAGDPARYVEAMEYLQGFIEERVISATQASDYKPSQHTGLRNQMEAIGYSMDETGQFSRVPMAVPRDATGAPKTSAPPLAPAPAQQEETHVPGADPALDAQLAEMFSE